MAMVANDALQDALRLEEAPQLYMAHKETLTSPPSNLNRSTNLHA
jgi:hypothetical protein